jgi:hypothetical protein
MADEARALLQTLSDDLAAAEGGSLAVDALAARWRGAAAPLLAALPANFGTVWHNLLDRLESAASFTDEACAVSQRDLLASLRLWVEKAGSRLG